MLLFVFVFRLILFLFLGFYFCSGLRHRLSLLRCWLMNALN